MGRVMGGEERSKARPNIWLYLGIVRVFPDERNTLMTSNWLKQAGVLPAYTGRVQI